MPSHRNEWNGKSPNGRDFDEARTAVLLGSILEGASAQVIGPAGSGKTRFQQHAFAEETIRYHLAKVGIYNDDPISEDNILTVVVDLNSVPRMPIKPNDLYCVILRELKYNADHAGYSDETVGKLDTIYQDALKDPTRADMLDQLKTACRVLHFDGVRRIVIAFDEFNFLIDHGDPIIYRHLRHLRDSFRQGSDYELCFIVFLRQPLTDLIPAELQEEAESFCDMFRNKPPIWLATYSTDDDARAVVRLLNSRDHGNRTLHPECVDRLIAVTGRYKSLLNVCFTFIDSVIARTPESQLAQAMLRENQVSQELSVIWNSLRPADRAALIRICAAGGNRVPSRRARFEGIGPVITRLINMGLLEEDKRHALRLTVPLLEQFIQDMEETRSARHRLSNRPTDLPR